MTEQHDYLDYRFFAAQVTASIDWCETNYAWSPFVAEFWNTVSMPNTYVRVVPT